MRASRPCTSNKAPWRSATHRVASASMSNTQEAALIGIDPMVGPAGAIRVGRNDVPVDGHFAQKGSARLIKVNATTRATDANQKVPVSGRSKGSRRLSRRRSRGLPRWSFFA
jgi:hypothetical protein